MKPAAYLSTILIIAFSITTIKAQAQNCNTGKVDPKVAEFLKAMPADKRSVEELKKTTNFQEYKKAGPPVKPYPATDVLRT